MLHIAKFWGIRTVVPEKTVEALIHALYDDDPTVRADAISALRQRNERRAIHNLIDVTLYDPDSSNRREAAWALAVLVNDEPGAIDRLSASLNDGDAQVRAFAAQALGRIPYAHPDANEKLIEALFDVDAVVRGQAALALMKQDVKHAIPALQPLLNDPALEVRNAARFALAGLEA